MRTFNRYGDTWTDGVWTIQITDTGSSCWASLSGPTRGAREAAAIDAQNLADTIEAGRVEPATDRLSSGEIAAIMADRWRPGMEPKEIIDMCANIAIRLIGDVERQCEQDRNDDATTAHEEDSAALADVTRILDEIGAPRVTYEGMGPARPAERLRAMLDQPADEDQKHDDDAFPSAELADVIALLDEFDAPRVQDTHTLTPANRLRLYLDQRAEQVRTVAEDDAKEWASDAYTQRGLVLALAVMGHAAWKRGAQ